MPAPTSAFGDLQLWPKHCLIPRLSRSDMVPSPLQTSFLHAALKAVAHRAEMHRRGKLRECACLSRDVIGCDDGSRSQQEAAPPAQLQPAPTWVIFPMGLQGNGAPPPHTPVFGNISTSANTFCFDQQTAQTPELMLIEKKLKQAGKVEKKTLSAEPRG